MHHPFWLILAVPVAGGLIVGHGMPEATEAILTGGSRIAPRVGLLKPVSAAISIGSGGPFGAEGPIIMTGGAVGSILAQALELTADERKTLLVAGAAGGMAATFNAPLASVLLAVELLLFEWRPRSLTPVGTSVAVSVICRGFLLGSGPIFPVATAVHPGSAAAALAIVPGVTGGLLAVAATGMVYLAEDGFARLPAHWMWWPAIGGAIIGLGGLVEPRALGVGYDVIDQLLTGRAGVSLVIGIFTVKTLIWSLSPGSGTSGGVMRSPLTGIVFTLELTHAWNDLLPLLVASISAYAVSALLLKRSVLTEKIARRSLHLTREYSIDPPEIFFAREVMTSQPETLWTGERLDAVLHRVARHARLRSAAATTRRARKVTAMRMFTFRALVDMETAAHGGQDTDLPAVTAKVVVRCHHTGRPGTRYLSALIATDDDRPLHAGDRYRVITLTTPDPESPRYLAPGDHFELRRGHDLGHGTVTRRVVL